MAEQNSIRRDSDGITAKDVRALDDVDRDILGALAEDGRIPNNALAERVGVAPSTCLSRMRALRSSGVIRGIHADIDPAAVGRPLQAMTWRPGTSPLARTCSRSVELST